jgi:hypothetical protein
VTPAREYRWGEYRWQPLLEDAPEPGLWRVVRDRGLSLWLHIPGNADWPWASVARETPQPLRATWRGLLDRGPLDLLVETVDVDDVQADVLGDLAEHGRSAYDVRLDAALLATSSSREACRDISGAEAVGAELVDLARTWQSYLLDDIGGRDDDPLGAALSRLQLRRVSLQRED